MSTTIEVVFDGKTFVPTKPVDLPAGTKANVEVPVAVSSCSVGASPSPMTANERSEWEAILAKLRDAELPWATVDEAVAAMRGEVWPIPGDTP